jgi:DNA (cytosine-5)-methyltransferase 1
MSYVVMENRYEITVLSLFSGCGGMDIPFSSAPYRILGAFDNDPAAIACLQHNLACRAVEMDVSQPEFEKELRKFQNVDIVLGGFPCQGFSKSGPKKHDDPRNKLYLAMLNAIETLRPSVFVAENVDGMAQNFNGSFVDRIQKDFSAAGYIVEHRIMNAVNYGVPQFRRRILFVGTRKNIGIRFSWPKPTHTGSSRNGEFKTHWDLDDEPNLFEQSDLEPSVTIKDAIGDLLSNTFAIPDQVYDSGISPKDLMIMNRIKEGQKLCNVRFSNTSIYTWDIPEVFGTVTDREKCILETIGKNRRKKIYGAIPNGNPLSIDVISTLSGIKIDPAELVSLANKGYLKETEGKYDLKGAMFCSGLYKRPSWTEPAPTILTVFNNPRYFFHPKLPRPFTIRECARLQSFPDSFEFLSSGVTIEDAYRVIGNAVPPMLAQCIEKEIRHFFAELRSSNEIEAKAACA